MASDETQCIDLTTIVLEPKSVFDVLRWQNKFVLTKDHEFINHPELRIAAALSAYRDGDPDLGIRLAYGDLNLDTRSYRAHISMCRAQEMNPCDFYTRLAERAQKTLTPGRFSARSSTRTPGV
ncbi:hypothetical protein HY492_01940 [Candidatus Woesearchaeota archaeon]|nr:hypothetical protein [Candidatus Woesearchaeota archaeon]